MQTGVIGSGWVAVSVWLGALVAAAPASAQQPAFSNGGRGVYDRLLKMQPAQRGGAWGVTADNVFDNGWLVPTPNIFGKRYGDLAQAATCNSGANCNIEFKLLPCRSNADCGARGLCAPYAPTLWKPGQQPENLCVGHSDEWVVNLYNLMVSGQ